MTLLKDIFTLWSLRHGIIPDKLLLVYVYTRTHTIVTFSTHTHREAVDGVVESELGNTLRSPFSYLDAT